ncbi:ribosome maturation factor RimP [Desulfobacca acetoxidans]|uniref:Ribosome maturation factor RimP n=1 Tax=Desulfobacca acetoxidans (strain ATCC 700848 / DSM 11109 / ASRB2) TaxID=880072 RepID=F2NFJ0_DESAR|nr:ribosome maturation factor RimP [Desulfobacca acetoxidans]AEB10109.1 Ribosome maturation factor rimP [Desulfobacca acetoxidans DSM 11109]
MQPDDVTGRVTELILPVLQAHDVELVETEFVRAGRRYILRLFLDKPGGISLEDCAYLSNLLGELIDVHDVIRHAYILEVSSPGLTRPIKKIEDFSRYAGRLVRITVRGGVGKRSLYRGELLGLDGETVKVKEGSRVYAIPVKDIARARLDIDL